MGGVGGGVLDDFDFKSIDACVFGEFLHEGLGDGVEELFAEVVRGVEDSAIVEDEVDVLFLVGVVAARGGALASVGDAAGESLIDEEFEGVVDGCQGDAWVGFADGLMEFFGGGVRSGAAEGFVDEKTRTGAADRAVGEDRPGRSVGVILDGVFGDWHGMILRESGMES